MSHTKSDAPGPAIESSGIADLLRPSPLDRPADGPVAKLREEMSLWRSEKMREVLHAIRQAAGTDATVLVRGETGTGKDLTARLIHHFSARRDGPFVKVNCAAVPAELLESELFGHERGAFTGAYQLRIGKFESANHGTMFLDEIGDLPAALQAKLLQVLQTREISRIGARSTITVDARIIAATNQDLETAVGAGRFREDLYFRLNVVPIVVPPLRERREEIPCLADHFVRRYARQFGREGFSLAKKSIDRLARYDYPGNIRELENIIKRTILLNDPGMLKTLPLPFDSGRRRRSPGPGDGSSRPLKEIARSAARAAERQAIARALAETSWNRRRAATLLKISYRAMLNKIKELEPERRAGSRTAGGDRPDAELAGGVGRWQ